MTSSRLSPAVLVVFALTACDGGAGSGSNIGDNSTNVDNGDPAANRVTVAAQPLRGADVTLWRAGNNGFGRGATQLATVSTDHNGHWSMSVDCEAESATGLYYVTVNDSNGTPENGSVVGLMAALGPCSDFSRDIQVSERTTIAGAYALAQFMDTDGQVGAPGAASASLGRAFSLATRLVDEAQGSSLPSATDCVVGSDQNYDCGSLHRFNSLANTLAACLLSDNSLSGACQLLFHCATMNAVFDGQRCIAGVAGGVPENTLQAIIGIARHPGRVSVEGIYRASMAVSHFVPALSRTPTDWTLSITHAGIGLNEPRGLAVDAHDNIWIANYDGGVVKLAPNGEMLSPPEGFTGGGLRHSISIAVHDDGSVWVANLDGIDSRGSVTKLDASGNILSGIRGFTGGGIAFPFAVAIDQIGNVWVANTGPMSVSKLRADGAPLSPAEGYTGAGVFYPVQLAIDGYGDVWVANQGNDSVSKLDDQGQGVSPEGGYTAQGLVLPQGIAVDSVGVTWASSSYGQSVVGFTSNGELFTPASGFAGGGIDRPAALVLDGTGAVWVNNYYRNSISHLVGANGDAHPGTPLSPDETGFTASSLSRPYGLAIDGAGNVWISNSGNDTLTQFIGVADPVRTPVVGPAVSSSQMSAL